MVRHSKTIEFFIEYENVVKMIETRMSEHFHGVWLLHDFITYLWKLNETVS